MRRLHVGAIGLLAIVASRTSAASPRGLADRRVDVELPATADGALRIADRAAGLAVEVRLTTASRALGERADGRVIYRGGAPGGGDVIHRITKEGTEDFVTFARHPAREELTYAITFGDRVAGLRLVERTIELLDADGAPRLRMAPPYVIDAAGARHEAAVAVLGCAYDADPRAPWGRPITAPGARRCAVRVAWGDARLSYPALVDPAWTATGNMVHARAHHTASVLTIAALLGKVLVAGGTSGKSIASAELYDPATGTWSVTGSLAVARREHTASVLRDGRILVAGGGSATNPGTDYLTSAELYDPVTGTWSATGSMTGARWLHTASVLSDGRVLVAGGGAGGVFPKSAELYDPLTHTWSPTGSLIRSRLWHSASTLASGAVLVAGGFDGASRLASAELYDPIAGTWSVTGTLGHERERHAALVLENGEVLVAAGDDGVLRLASAERYDPIAGTWSATGSLNEVRTQPTMSAFGSGRALIVAGAKPSNKSQATKSVELYDLATGAWKLTAGLDQGRSGHSMSVLWSGAILIAGGADSEENFLPIAQLFAFAPLGDPCSSPDECTSGSCRSGICACAAAPPTCGAGGGDPAAPGGSTPAAREPSLYSCAAAPAPRGPWSGLPAAVAALSLAARARRRRSESARDRRRAALIER